MASNTYLGMDPQTRERNALYAASGRVGQPQAQSSYMPQMTQQKPLTGGLAGLNMGGTSYKPGMGPGLTMTGVGLGANIASRQATNALTGGASGAASSAPAWASGAAGMGAGIGIQMAGSALAEKHRVKEDLPEFGGRHASILDGFGRRYEGTGGGIRHGAELGATYGSNPALLAATGGISAGVGAAAGAIAAAITKNAKSAFTDYSAGNGAQGIQQAYRDYLGREAGDDEVLNHMRAVGWKEGDRWMGEKPENYILDAIADSPEAKAYQARLGSQPSGSLGDGETPLPFPGQDLGTPSTPSALPGLGTPGVAQSPGQSFLSSQTSEGSGGFTGKMDQPGEFKLDEASPAPMAANPAWDTDGYAPPALTAQGFSPDPPAGWDKKKWNDENHQTPKYVWGRITQDGDPNDIQQLLAAYPGAQFDGKDKVSGIPGLGVIDIYQGASTGNPVPQWLDLDAQAAEGGGAPAMGAPGAEGPTQTSQLMQLFAQRGQGGSSQRFSPLVLQYLLQGLGLDRAASRLE